MWRLWQTTTHSYVFLIKSFVGRCSYTLINVNLWVQHFFFLSTNLKKRLNVLFNMGGGLRKQVHNEFNWPFFTRNDRALKSLTDLAEPLFLYQSKCCFHIISTRSQAVNVTSTLLSSIFYVTPHFTNMTEQRKWCTAAGDFLFWQMSSPLHACGWNTSVMLNHHSPLAPTLLHRRRSDSLR